MANITLKKSIGDAGAGMDKSHGDDTLYDVIKAQQGQINEVVTAYGELRTKYNAVLAKLDTEALAASDYVSTQAQAALALTDTITIED